MQQYWCWTSQQFFNFPKIDIQLFKLLYRTYAYIEHIPIIIVIIFTLQILFIKVKKLSYLSNRKYLASQFSLELLKFHLSH